jgi:hypothetical protein
VRAPAPAGASVQLLMPLKDSWLFPIIQSVHLAGIGVLAGSIFMAGLRQLGYALQQYSVPEVVERFARWRLTGLAIVFTTGPVLFISDVTRYVHNSAFLLKMTILLLAVIFQFERRGKLGAAVSILLWGCVILGGRAIADFDR